LVERKKEVYYLLKKDVDWMFSFDNFDRIEAKLRNQLIDALRGENEEE